MEQLSTGLIYVKYAGEAEHFSAPIILSLNEYVGNQPAWIPRSLYLTAVLKKKKKKLFGGSRSLFLMWDNLLRHMVSLVVAQVFQNPLPRSCSTWD